MPPECGYVYMLADGYKRIYTGVTSRLQSRVAEHKQKLHPRCFTARYNIHQLVFYEVHPSITQAIAREKQIKGWLCIKKLQLIVAANPTWRDLSLGWKKVHTFDEANLRPPATF